MTVPLALCVCSTALSMLLGATLEDSCDSMCPKLFASALLCRSMLEARSL